MTDLHFMDALKIRERYALAQAEIMDKAARALERIQEEMQGRWIARGSRAPFGSQRPEQQHPPPSGLESFEQEGGLRAQVDAAARAMGLADKRAEAL